MSFAHTRIAITGTHSTGKSTFLGGLHERLKAHGLRVARVADVASEAQKIGFPILRDHVYESTLWIIAEGMRREMEAALKADVVLVDRPTLDAVGYLLAALDATGRTEDRLDELNAIAKAHTSYYDWIAVTVLDEAIPLGAERDPDLAFRRSAARLIDKLAAECAPRAHKLRKGEEAALMDMAVKFVLARHG